MQSLPTPTVGTLRAGITRILISYQSKPPLDGLPDYVDIILSISVIIIYGPNVINLSLYYSTYGLCCSTTATASVVECRRKCTVESNKMILVYFLALIKSNLDYFGGQSGFTGFH